jgi:hypothetical protein
MRFVLRTADHWCAWARVEHREGRMDRAEAGFRRALALDPSSLPARFGLASVLLDNGAVQEAAAVAAQMASDAADRPEVLSLQARIAYGRGDAGGARDAAPLRLAPTASPAGELVIRRGCDGPILAAVPLARAARDGTAGLLDADIPPQTGPVDLCLTLARPTPDPLWVLGWVALRP